MAGALPTITRLGYRTLVQMSKFVLASQKFAIEIDKHRLPLWNVEDHSESPIISSSAKAARGGCLLGAYTEYSVYCLTT